MNQLPADVLVSEFRPPEIGTSSTHWFLRGLAGGVMLVAACNALSYFFRTAGIADLIGSDTHVTESIGFPFEIWRENAVYHGTFFINYSMVAVNLIAGLALGAVFGVFAIKLRHHFNRWILEFEQQQVVRKKVVFQFSVKSMLYLTTLAAVLIATLTSWKGTPEVLIAIYFFGPLALIVIAMLPNRIHWKHRIAILSLTAIAMIGIAIWSGMILGVPSDRVLLGIFVSWTPQSAFGAFLLTMFLIVQLFWFDECQNATPLKDA